MPTPPPVRYGPLARRPPEGAIDLGALVPGQGELELEIGFGRGAFLLGRARVAPASRIVGLEIKAKLAHQVEERRSRERLENAVALHGDAREVLARSGPDGALRRVFVHFPDPWWKKRHHKRQVVDPGFLDQIARLLAAQGELFVQSDVEDRAAAVRDLVGAHPAFELVPCDHNPFGARSNREVRADEDGLPVHRVLCRRRA